MELANHAPISSKSGQKAQLTDNKPSVAYISIEKGQALPHHSAIQRNTTKSVASQWQRQK